MASVDSFSDSNSENNENEHLETEINNLKRLILEDEEEDSDETGEEAPQFSVADEFSSDDGDEMHERSKSLSSEFMDNESSQSLFDGDDGPVANDIPQSLETCLALNQAYQDVLQETINELESVLESNHQQQEHVKAQMADPESIKYLPKRKQSFGRLSVFLQPYFKDVKGAHPPENEDVKIKRKNLELNAYLTRPRQWNEVEVENLLQGTKINAKQKAMQPVIDKKEYFLEKLKDTSVLSPNEIEAAQKAVNDANIELERISNLKEEELLGSREQPLDWLRISNKDLDKLRSAEECELFWKNYLHPSINKEPWTDAEDDRLRKLVEKWQTHNWDAVAEELRTNRTGLQCMQRYMSALLPPQPRRTWTSEDDNLLSEVVKSCSIGDYIPWHQVEYYFDNRNKRALKDRWTRLQSQNLLRRKWSLEEDMMLLVAIKKHGLDYLKLSSYFKDRNNQQCRERYVNALQKQINRAPFTEDEDAYLLELVNKYGESNWSFLVSYFPGRTDNQLLRRYRILRHAALNHPDGIKSIRIRKKHSDNHEAPYLLVDFKMSELAKQLKAKRNGEEVPEDEVIEALVEEMKTILANHYRILEGKKKYQLRKLHSRSRHVSEVNISLLNYFKSTLHCNALTDSKKGVCIAGRNARLYHALVEEFGKVFKLKEPNPFSTQKVKQDPIFSQCASEAIDKYICGRPLEDADNRVPILPPNPSNIAAFETLLVNKNNLKESYLQANCDNLIDLLSSKKTNVICTDYENVFDEVVLHQWIDVSAPDANTASQETTSSNILSVKSEESNCRSSILHQPSSSGDSLSTDKATVPSASDDLSSNLEKALDLPDHHEEENCKRCHALNKLLGDFEILKERFLSLFLWPAVMSKVSPPEQNQLEEEEVEKAPKKKRKKYYRRKNAVKRPWLKEVASKYAQLRRAEAQLLKQFAETAKSDEQNAEPSGQAESEPNAGAPSGEGDAPTKRKRGRPKGYRPPPKKKRSYAKRAPAVKKPKDKVLEAPRRSTRVATKRQIEDDGVPEIVKKLKLSPTLVKQLL